VRTYEEALGKILSLSREIENLDRTRKDWDRGRDLNADDRTEKLQILESEIRRRKEDRIGVLKDLVQVPPHHPEYAKVLDKFNKAAYSRRVFIMTKYPDGADAKLDEQLQTVINTVKDAVEKRFYLPLLATDDNLHSNLWENVECYMLACARGIAIVEDRFSPKINPNVAMEWGWMRAMNKPVLFLVEKAVPQSAADVMGLIKGRFDWDNPEADIPRLIAEDLKIDGF
jgi:hypothetical protein